MAHSQENLDVVSNTKEAMHVKINTKISFGTGITVNKYSLVTIYWEITTQLVLIF